MQFVEVVPISAQERYQSRTSYSNVIRDLICRRVSLLFPQGHDNGSRHGFSRCREVFREKLLADATYDEVPYGLAVEVLALEERE